MTYEDERQVIRTRTEDTQVGSVPPPPPNYQQGGYPPQQGGYPQPGYDQGGYAPPPGYQQPGYVPPARPAYGTSVSRQSTVVERRRNPGEFVERLVDLLFGIIVGLIILRIVLLLVAARESNSLVSGIYGITEIFVAPFRGILRIDEVDAGRSELDVSAIVAVVGVALIWLLVRAILRLFRPRGDYA